MQANLRRANAAPGLDEQELLARVNQWVNREIAYIGDDRNYRQRDYWATAEQTIARGKGDCEDFAILKMQMLRADVAHQAEQRGALHAKMRRQGGESNRRQRHEDEAEAKPLDEIGRAHV